LVAGDAEFLEDISGRRLDASQINSEAMGNACGPIHLALQPEPRSNRYMPSRLTLPARSGPHRMDAHFWSLGGALHPQYDKAMIGRLLSFFLVPTAALAVVAMTPLGAQAQSDVTISIGSTGTLAPSRVVATVPVQITCAPVGTVQAVQEGATLEQAAGHAIASGSGFSDQPIVCDGTPHANSFTFSADATGPPFHGGPASVNISLFIFGSDGFESGGSGFQTVSLVG
jgi:hypothetical protein